MVPRQASGCILDQLEKVCEGEAAEMIAPNALENVWMCCHLDHDHLDPWDAHGDHRQIWKAGKLNLQLGNNMVKPHVCCLLEHDAAIKA